MEISTDLTIVKKIPKNVETDRSDAIEFVETNRKGLLLLTESGKLDDVQDAVQTSLSDRLMKTHIKRKTCIETNNQNIEALVQECHSWKRQLDSMTDSNRILKAEQKVLLKDYEKLLEKTKCDADIILTLKDSENKLMQEVAKSTEINRNLRTSYYVKDELAADKKTLKIKKDTLIEKLDMDNLKMTQMNADYEKIQNKILEQMKLGESNRLRYKEVSTESEKVLSRVEKMLADFDEALLTRENIKQDIEDFVSCILKPFLMKKNEISEESKSTSFSQLEEKTEAKHSDEQSVKVDFSEISNEENGSVADESEVAKEEKETQSNDSLENKYLIQIAKKENKHLLEVYSLINDRLDGLNDKLFQARKCRDEEEEMNKKLLEKSDQLEKVILMKRREFVMPLRNPAEELNIRIHNQMNENEALRDLLSLCFSFKTQDFYLNKVFMEEINELYKPFLNKLDKQNDSTTSGKSD